MAEHTDKPYLDVVAYTDWAVLQVLKHSEISFVSLNWKRAILDNKLGHKLVEIKLVADHNAHKAIVYLRNCAGNGVGYKVSAITLEDSGIIHRFLFIYGCDPDFCDREPELKEVDEQTFKKILMERWGSWSS